VAASNREVKSSAKLQAPPNLTPLEESTGADGSGDVAASWSALLAAGINDWGGVSPLTRDWVNPEKAWPHVSALAEVTAAAGFPLLPRYLNTCLVVCVAERLREYRAVEFGMTRYLPISKHMANRNMILRCLGPKLVP